VFNPFNQNGGQLLALVYPWDLARAAARLARRSC